MQNYSIAKLQLIKDYQVVRKKTEELCKSLAVEDYVIQSIADVSPPKWHLAHTSWFFETFVLIPQFSGYQLYNPLFQYLFNSYYHGIGTPYPRAERGFLSRPTVTSIFAYRKFIDNNLINFLNQTTAAEFSKIQPTITLGLHHEQQHQELILMDIKHNFSLDPSFPVFYSGNPKNSSDSRARKSSMEFVYSNGGVIEIGNTGNLFCFDNELPRHKKYINPYLIATRLVTNEEYYEFIAAEGYKKSNWWLADGWEFMQQNQITAPLYWQKIDNKWHIFTLAGLKELDLNEPVSHISYFEADAYARWCNRRLPTEEEWEHFVCSKNIKLEGNFMDNALYHPRATLNESENLPQQFFGDLWEWTMSSYGPYPGFKPLTGAIGEYNGKFMNNQMVLRGGSCVTPLAHIRPTYRNFFQPEKRWQFSGIRLCSDI